jgi:hypothetical protein
VGVPTARRDAWVRVTVQGTIHDLIAGINEVQINILRLFGVEICRLYQIAPG